MNIVRNTYPIHKGIAHGKTGDLVRWSTSSRSICLIRISDGKTVFSRNKLPFNTNDERPMTGIISQVKNKGWTLELEEESP